MGLNRWIHLRYNVQVQRVFRSVMGLEAMEGGGGGGGGGWGKAVGGAGGCGLFTARTQKWWISNKGKPNQFLQLLFAVKASSGQQSLSLSIFSPNSPVDPLSRFYTSKYPFTFLLMGGKFNWVNDIFFQYRPTCSLIWFLYLGILLNLIVKCWKVRPIQIMNHSWNVGLTPWVT